MLHIKIIRAMTCQYCGVIIEGFVIIKDAVYPKNASGTTVRMNLNTQPVLSRLQFIVEETIKIFNYNTL